MDHLSACAFFALVLIAFHGMADSFCIYNDLSQQVGVSASRNAASEGFLRILLTSGKYANHINGGEQSCCPWDNGDCFDGSADRPWESVGLWVFCGRDTRGGSATRVYLPAGGALRILPSPSGDDNFIDVYGHLEDKLYWYRCGVDEERHPY